MSTDTTHDGRSVDRRHRRRPTPKPTTRRPTVDLGGRSAATSRWSLLRQLLPIMTSTVILLSSLPLYATATTVLLSATGGQHAPVDEDDGPSVEYWLRAPTKNANELIDDAVEEPHRRVADVRLGWHDYSPMLSDAAAAPEEDPLGGASGGRADMKSHCQYPCSCQKDPPRCKMGNTIKDGCNCCHICPRQQGDLCDSKFRCDDDRGLYCDFILDDGHRGICRAKSPKSCEVDGRTYKDGEEVRTCSQLCTCQNGQYACASLCPQEDRPPSRTHCRDAQLVTIVGQCCREWVCPHAHSLPQPDDTDHPAAPGLPAEQCVKETTEWSPCSVTCGMGVSTRLTNNNKECRSKQERQLCLIRPCNLDDKSIRPTGNKCRSTWRDRDIHLQYGECTSVEKYRPKYCTTCKKNRCCGPGRTKTKEVAFRCPDGKRITEQFMWIGSCECRHLKTCPYAVVYDEENRRI